jgi:hypothetical protein
LGCSDSDTLEERLKGVWLSQINDDCAQVLVFQDGNKLEVRYVCVDEAPRIEIEVHAGTYEVDGSRLMFNEETGTCAEPLDLAEPTLKLDKTLRLAFPDEITVFESVDSKREPGAGGTLVLGCYDEETGVFAPHPATRF